MGLKGMDELGMPDIPLGESGQLEPVTSLQFVTPTLRALDVLGAEENMDVCRQELLEELVFAQLQTNKQPESSYKRLLLTTTAHKIIKVFWKESSFISDSELAIMGMTRNFPANNITQHGLAVLLSEEPSDVSGLNTKIRSVTIAAAAFGLIERKPQSARRLSLCGTSLLHEFMVELALRQMQFIRTIGTRCCDPNGQ
jgi:hypothetical protein